MIKADRERLNKLSELGCVVCSNEGRGFVDTEIHHLKGHRWSGMGKRASHLHTIPLCPVHHRHGGPVDIGYHQSPRQFEERYGSQADLLEQVNGELSDD